MSGQTVVSVETMSIPTYPVMDCETMPMFNENRQHQGTKGNPYPVMPVLSVVREDKAPVEYEVIRLENDYIRLIIIPRLGGRIFEAYDKVNDYHFLYRQHVIKPALIGAYGLWISGGLEFNWPFHHRPSTFMPVNFTTETQADGTAIAWLSECDPTDRTRATVGIVLRPDAAWFETRIQVTNRTPLRHSFLMWQNGAVRVNENYQFIFPPDVTYVTHHHSSSRAPLTYPVAQGSYAGGWYDDPTDISWYKNNHFATSHFAAPSKYDFFGGYDHGRRRGVIHISDRFVSPGKKMFTWGVGDLGASWEKALTDEDGPYCELMAGSFSNNQPDFTWLNPYESKTFSEYWYPVGALGRASFATLEAAVFVDGAAGVMRVQTTRAQKRLTVALRAGGADALNARIDTEPCRPVELRFAPFEGMYEIVLTDDAGEELLRYAQEKPDALHMPEPVALNPHPDDIATVQELWLQGMHADQYRHPQIEPSVYYEEALRRDPEHIPSLTALGEYCLRRGFFDRACELLTRAVVLEHTCNLHYPDGSALYLLGLTLDALGREDEAYKAFREAGWSGNSVAMALCKAAALAGRRGDFRRMLRHAEEALDAAARHPVASAYAAMASYRLGQTDAALKYLDRALKADPLNDLAAFLRGYVMGDTAAFFEGRRSDASQTALDMAFDLADAGLDREALAALDTAKTPTTPMVYYLRASLEERLGCDGKASRDKARNCAPRSVFPYRLSEMLLLEQTIKTSPDDASARNLLAGLLYDRGHYDRAAQLWREALALCPDTALYARNLAVALFSHLGEQDKALTLLERAIGLDPARDQYKLEYLYAAVKAGVPGKERLRVIDGNPWVGRPRDDYVLEHAHACCDAGDYDRALRVMLSHNFVPAEGGELAITHMYFLIRLREARSLLKDGQPQAALAVLDALEGALPENLHAGLWNDVDLVPVRRYRAEALAALGRTEESRAAYERALRHFNPGLPGIAHHGATALRALGRAPEAQAFLSRVVRALDEKAARRSIGWETMTSSFNSYVIDQQAQREGMLAYWYGLIRLAEGDERAAEACFIRSLDLWPENLDARIELDVLRHGSACPETR